VSTVAGARLHAVAVLVSCATMFLLTCQTAKTDGVLQVNVTVSSPRTAQCVKLVVTDSNGARVESEAVALSSADTRIADVGNGKLLWKVDVRRGALGAAVTAQALALGVDCTTPVTAEHSGASSADFTKTSGPIELFVPPLKPIDPDGGPVTDEQCADGVDNDMNGLTDCADPRCPEATACGTGVNGAGASCRSKNCVETDCSNGEDDNRSGEADCKDSACDSQGCAGGGTCNPATKVCQTERETACGDGDDNDGDSFTDCRDLDCNTLGCSDGLRCTTGEVCATTANGAGSCNLSGVKSTCEMPNQCQVQGQVGLCADTDGGTCVYQARTNQSCDAGSKCATSAQCSATAVCEVKATKMCPSVTCKKPVSCDPGTGECPAASENEADFTACTAPNVAAGACIDGACTPRQALSNFSSTLLDPPTLPDIVIAKDCQLTVASNGNVNASGSGCPSPLPVFVNRTQMSPQNAGSVHVLVARRIEIYGAVRAGAGTNIPPGLAFLARDELVLGETGVIDVSALGSSSGAGAGQNCVANNIDGKVKDSKHASGGAGGTFGTIGGAGGDALDRNAKTEAAGGTPRATDVADPDQMPLRGGCRGGNGGGSSTNGGRGGGSVQLYAGLRMKLEGQIAAAGSGGKGGAVLAGVPVGGGGAGSGGGILIEASRINIAASAKLTAMGGGGGAGSSVGAQTGNGESGQTETGQAALGGKIMPALPALGQGGNGAGVVPLALVVNGGNGTQPGTSDGISTGGGGGGGLGIIHINAGASCTKNSNALVAAQVSGTTTCQ
jgi:hypothetical protein